MSRLSSMLRLVCLVSLGSCCGCPDSSGKAQEAPQVQIQINPSEEAGDEAAAKPAEVDAKSRAVIDAFAAYVKGLKSFSLEERAQIKGVAEGEKVEMDMTQDLRVERPSRLYMSTEAGAFAGAAATFVCDGQKLYCYVAAFERYSESDAPATLDEIAAKISPGLTGVFQVDPFTAAMMSDDPAVRVLRDVSTVKHLGTEKIGDQECDHLRMVIGQMDYDAWITIGERRLPIKMVPNIAGFVANIDKQGSEESPLADMFKDMQASMSITNFKPNVELTVADFAFTPPDDAEKVDDLFAALGGEDADAEVKKLLGLPAPAFELELYGGGKADLASNKDKVVMLDFWASWCGPCLEALPKVSALAEKYKDQGLVFYAVNLEEDADTIRAALEEDKLALSVAMDAKGAVAAAYFANAIPQTVLIGRDGTVQAVHVGGSPELEAQLAKEIEALLDGKKLAEPPPADQEGDEGAGDAEKKKTDKKPGDES